MRINLAEQYKCVYPLAPSKYGRMVVSNRDFVRRYLFVESFNKVCLFLRDWIPDFYRYLYGEKRFSSTAEALLFAGDRFDHVENEIMPALKKGQLVVSDRYVFSSLAYQGAAGLDLEWIKKINRYAVNPDLAIFIDVDPDVVMRRLKRKKSIMEELETQQKVREIYMKYAKEGALVRIEGNKAKKNVLEDLLSTVVSFLNSRV